MQKNDYLSKLELKSILQIKNSIEAVLIIKNKYLILKSLDEIAVFSIGSNKLKFKIPLIEKKEKNFFYKEFIFDLNYKLRLINNEENINTYKILTDKYLININLKKNIWEIINKLEKGIYIYNLDILNQYDNGTYISDQTGKKKKKLKLLA